MGAVDLVLLVEAPGSTARGLQRVGRAGHAVGERSRGLIFPKFRGDLLECTVTGIQMQRGAIESMRMPENPLDMLAQQVVAMCCDREVLRQIKRRTLTKLRREAEPVDGAALARLRSDRPARRAATVMADSGRTHPAGPGAGVPGRDAGPPGVGGRSGLGRSRPVGGTGRQGGVYRRDRVGSLARALREPGAGGQSDGENGREPEEQWTGALHRAVLSRLETRGACFTFDLVRGVVGAGEWGETEVEGAIWELVWAGRITNDTFLPLASLGKRGRPAAERRSRGLPRGWRRGPGAGMPFGGVRSQPSGARRGRAATLAGGRWSLVADLAVSNETIGHTQWAHATATLLLDRYGVVAAETARAEGIPGGFEAIYPVLREMEEVGHLRRGYFVHGLAGRQFALPAAVERLRRQRRAPTQGGRIEILPAVDPANPWGAVMPWPQLGSQD